MIDSRVVKLLVIAFILISFTNSWQTTCNHRIQTHANIQIKNFTFILTEGWNFINLPLNTSYKNAAQLADAIPNCTHIGRWNSSSQVLDIYAKGAEGNNFRLELGVGYFVYLTSNATFSVEGTAIINVKVNLTLGWNSIGWFNETTLDAETLAKNIPDCKAVAYWSTEKQRFIVHPRAVNISNFSVVCGNGYLIYIEPLVWGCNLHPEAPDACYNITKACEAFEYIANLGCRFVRTDFCWYDLEHTNNNWNESMINWYNEYINAARTYGLDVLVILYRYPQWSVDLYNSNKTKFFEEFEEYCAKVASLYGDRIYYYQLWNEANHPTADPIAAEDDWKLFYYANRGLALYDSNYKSIVNILCNTLGWEDDLNNWLSNAKESIDIIGIDHYPGTWTATGYDDWYPLDALINRITNPTDPCYGKEGAIMETGYSTYVIGHAEPQQQDFINTALPIIKDKVKAHNRNHTNKIILANWYELIDSNSGGGGDIEYHFGVLYTDRAKKPAYEDLAYQIKTFTQIVLN